MAYSQEISRQNRAYFVFLIDQSTSMEEPIGGEETMKKDAVARAVNTWLQNMVIRATGGEGVKDWMDISVIGYRSDNEANPIISVPLSGTLTGREVVSITEIAENPTRMETLVEFYMDDETGEMLESNVESPVWVEPVAEGATPMCSALVKVYELIDEWIQKPENANSFPPMILHFTDGESTEGDPIPYADPIKEDLETTDGKVLLFNCHTSMVTNDPVLFPSSGELLPEELARTLYQMSSELPDKIIQEAAADGYDVQAGARGFAFNADTVTLVGFLDMGTRGAAGGLR
ncbi:MAG: hypothetical protein VB855_09800 [Pirellulaceae bacterium]